MIREKSLYLLDAPAWTVTLIREFLGTERHRACLMEKKSKNIACDVTVGTKKIKLYVQIQCQLSYIMMLISNGICQYVWKYAVLNENTCHFLGPSPSVFSGKKIQSTETYTSNATLRPGFFRKHAR